MPSVHFFFLAECYVPVTKAKGEQNTLWQLPTPGKAPEISANCILVLPRKTHTVKPWMEQHLTHLKLKKRPSKMSFNYGGWSPITCRSLLAADKGQFAYLPTHTPLVLYWKNVNLSPVESEILNAGGMNEDHWHIPLSRTKEHTVSLKQEKTFPHKAICTIVHVGSLSLDKKVFHVQGQFLCGRAGVEWLHMRLYFAIHFKWVLRETGFFQDTWKTSNSIRMLVGDLTS